MLSKTFDVTKSRIVAAGGKVGGVSFANVEVRVNDGSNLFVKGDKFTMPSGEELANSKFIQNFRGNPAYGVIVNVGGQDKPFYLSAFTKAVVPYNSDSQPATDAEGKRVPAVIARGSAVDLWKKHGNAEEALNAIAGKTIEISDIQTVATLRLRNNGTRTPGNQQVFEINIVDADKKSGGKK